MKCKYTKKIKYYFCNLTKKLFMKQFPNLTPIRFFLALLVVLFHVHIFAENRGLSFFNQLPILNKGKDAVFMFFSLSGFLIIRQLFEEKSTSGGIHLKNFYMRRILRIWPLYFLVLIFGFLYYRLILPFVGFEAVTDYPLMKAVLLNVFFLPNVTAFLYKPGGIIEILWSIGVEEQFYIFIAPMMSFFRKPILLLSVFTSVVIIGFMITPELNRFGMYYFFFTISGIVAILKDKIILPKFIKVVLLVLTLIYFFTDLFLFENVMLYLLFGATLFAFFLHSISSAPIFEFKSKLMHHLGKISYGIYMYHAIVLHLVFFFFMKFKLDLPKIFLIVLYNLIVVFITIIVSYVSYQYFENKFLKLKKEFK